MNAETVESLLADPNFDVEEFIYNVRLHLTRPIIKALINDPYVLLSIAEGKDYEILTKHPPKSSVVYDKLFEMGLETWVKNTNSWWRGVIVKDDLAIFGRNHIRSECMVFTGEKAAEKARKFFKKLKMHNKEEGLQPGKRPVDLIRAITAEMINKIIKTRHRRWSQNDATRCSFFFDITNTWDPRHHENLNYKIISRGHSILVKVRVARKDPDYQKKLKAYKAKKPYQYWNAPREYIDNWESIKIDMRKNPKSKTDKSYRSAQEIAEEIITYIRSKHTKMNEIMSSTC